MSAFEGKASAQLYRPDSKNDAVMSEKKGTEEDQRDMSRMGKKQEFRRNFGFVSIFGYSMTLMATWETLLT
jgi:choline transport protein